MHPVGRWLLALLVAATATVSGGCSGPRAGARALGGIGVALTAGGGLAWAAGERGGPAALVPAGFAGLAAGVAAVLAAGAWLTAGTTCEADPDCGDAEECREVPTIQQGGTPYKMCVPR